MKLSVVFLMAAALLAQEEAEEGARQLWNSSFRKQRATAQGAPRAAPAPGGEALVGVTLWLLRESRPGDEPEAQLAARGGVAAWTPVRMEADTPLAEGQRVRVGIEVGRAGYLYVIDREQYAGGSYGAPHLIFPSLRLAGGQNEVKAGRLVEIPSLEDNPRYFTIRMSRPDQVAEVLTVLVTPQPLAEIKIGRSPLPLSAEQVKAWEQRWGAKVERLEAKRQVGRPYTKAEKQAATLQTRLLAHDEPLPQTLYRLEAKPGEALLLSVPLRIKR